METNIITATFRTKETIIAEVKATIEHVETTALLGAIKIGKCYTELKELIPHGGWYKYIEENTGHSTKKVERFMKIAAEFGDENTTLGRLFSNPTISSDLSIYKALSLIALPEEEVETFVSENEIGAMTVKDLEEKIKQIQAEKDKMQTEAKKLQEDLRKAYVENDAYSAREQELVDQINELQEQKPSSGPDQEAIHAEVEKAIDEAKKLYESIRKEKEASDEKVDKLKKQLEQQKADAAQIVEKEKEKAAQEARAGAAVEYAAKIETLARQYEEANKAAEEAMKKLQASSNTDLVKFKLIVDQLQLRFQDAMETIDTIGKNNEEQAQKFRRALAMVLEKMQEGIRCII